MEQGPRRGAGAVEEFDWVRFGGPTLARETHVTVTSAVRLVPNNPDRIMVIISNNGPDALYWSLNGNPAFPNVQQLGTGQQMVFQVQNDGQLCSREIWGVASVATAEVNIVIVSRQHG